MAAGISVALCTWNGAAHLEEQLDSILAQRRLPDQLIACDDDSDDDSAAILSRFAARAPAHWSGPRGVPARPESSPRQATITRSGANRTTCNARKRTIDTTRTACVLVARREASRHTSTTPIQNPIPYPDALDRFMDELQSASPAWNA